MNILGIGPVEFILIFIIALVVAGPKRILQWAYIMGQYLARFRVMWSEVMRGLQSEMDSAGMDITLPKDIPTRRDISRMAEQAMKPVAEELQAQDRAIRQGTNIKLESKPAAHRTNSHMPESPPSGDTGRDEPSRSDFGSWSSSGRSEE